MNEFTLHSSSVISLASHFDSGLTAICLVVALNTICAFLASAVRELVSLSVGELSGLESREVTDDSFFFHLCW